MMSEVYYYKNEFTEIIAIRTNHEKYVNYVYLYIDKQTKQAFIVDPAWDVKKIETFIKNVAPQFVLLTHSHEDHTNLANYFAHKYDIPVYISKKERDYYSFNCANLITLNENQVIDLGQDRIECLLTSGHTHGSMCYLTKNSLFSGDTLFIESCGATDFPGGSVDDLYDSIEFLKHRISDEIMIFPGHKIKTDVGKVMKYVKEHNVYFQIEDKEMFAKIKKKTSTSNILFGC